MADTDRITGPTTAIAWKQPCRLATTQNIVLRDAQTIDGVAIADGDRILVKDQDDATENGIWIAQENMPWARAPDSDGTRDLAYGTHVWVMQGYTHATTFWRVSSTDSPTIIGTTEITWAESYIGGSIGISGGKTGDLTIGGNVGGYLAISGGLTGDVTIGQGIKGVPSVDSDNLHIGEGDLILSTMVGAVAVTGDVGGMLLIQGNLSGHLSISGTVGGPVVINNALWVPV